MKPLLSLFCSVLAVPLVLSAQTPPVVALQNLAHAVDSLDKTVPFYRDVIGLPVNGTHDPLPASAANTTGDILGFGLIEYSGVARQRFSLGASDPGSPAFTMVVRDIDAAVEQWTKAGGTVFSTGGKAIKRANGAGNVFVLDVNGFMWELIQRPQQ